MCLAGLEMYGKGEEHLSTLLSLTLCGNMWRMESLPKVCGVMTRSGDLLLVLCGARNPRLGVETRG